jgi:transposase
VTVAKNVTADQLRALMREHGLSNRDIAELASVHPKTVESWLADPKAASFRHMAPRHLSLILALLPGFTAARRGRK